MGDVERLCDRILVVDRGRLAYDGDLAGLVPHGRRAAGTAVDLTEPAQPLDGIAGTRLVGVGGRRPAAAARPRRRHHRGAGAARVSGRAQVRDLAIEEPDIEDVVRRLYESTGR